jgi:hypothetical protein
MKQSIFEEYTWMFGLQKQPTNFGARKTNWSAQRIAKANTETRMIGC